MSKSVKKHYLVEVVEEKPKCLLVSSSPNKFGRALTRVISETHTLYESSSLEEKWPEFDLVIFLGVVPDDMDSLKGVKNCYFVFFGQLPLFESTKRWLSKNLKHYKVINLGLSKRTISELVDYLVFRTPSPYVFNFASKTVPRPLITISPDPKKNILLSLKILFGGILGLNLLFLAFFLGEWALLFRLSRTSFQDTTKIRSSVNILSSTQGLSRNLSQIPKNTLFWLPGIDGFMAFVETTNKTAETVVSGAKLLDDFGVISSLVTKKNKEASQVAEIKLRLKRFDKNINQFSSDYYLTFSSWQRLNLPFFNRKKNEYLTQAQKAEEYLALGQKISKELPSLLGANGPRQYLVLFMNNMELRPGGGFIGSLSTLKFENYSLKDVRVYDVYTLDGQLRTHLDPPQPIREHLNQPHWFLRDSNWSPDFSLNAKEALRFVRQEVRWNEFDGVFGVTLSTVQKVLALFPDFYLPDYNETVTADNFFLKAQTHAEQGFFPGSHQKKNFLQAVFQSLILKLEEGVFDPWKLGLILRGLFEEKQAVVYFEDPSLQAVFDELFWTGRVVSTECNFQKDCFSDYLYVVDANLGVNKTNFFVQRTIRLNTTVGSDRVVNNILTLDYYNESVPSVFPGGNYKNYVQIYLPKKTKLKEILVGGNPAEKYDLETELNLRKIGLLINVPPSSKENLVVKYQFEDTLSSTAQYQLIIQKQIGSINNDFVYEMHLPPGLSLKQSNFAPIVRRDSFVYNTFLQKDRILIVDFK